VDIQGSDIGPGPVAGVLAFDAHGCPRPTVLRGVPPAACLKPRLFAIGDDELMILHRAAEDPWAGLLLNFPPRRQRGGQHPQADFLQSEHQRESG